VKALAFRPGGALRSVLACWLLAGCAAPRGVPVERAHSVASQSTPAAEPTPPAVEPLPPLQLSFIDDFNAPPPAPLAEGAAPAAAWDAALGGLSGLYYSEREQRLYAVSDDGRRFPPRLYVFGVELAPGTLRVVPERVLPLREAAPSGLLEEIDAEAITGDGERLFLSLEGHDERPQQRESRVIELRADGTIAGSVPVPADFRPAPAGQPPRGTRSNRGFEGLALSPGGRFLWAISESSLEQDGAEASFEHGAHVRLCRWQLGTSAAPVQYRYPIEPSAPRPPSGGGCEGCNGVSELVALDERRLLVLERSYVELSPDERGRNVVRIFEVEVPQAPPPAGAPPLLAKRLVLDLDTVVSRFDAEQQLLDNFEGMTLGPPSARGARSLLLVSDDNLSPRQRTVFLAFELR
jgi:hypothetical protein